MATNALGLGLVIKAENKASPVLKQVGADLGNLRNQIGRDGRSMSDTMGGMFRDASGRLRDGRGKFVGEARATGQAAGNALSSGLSRALGIGGGGGGLGLGGLVGGLGIGAGMKGILDEGGKFSQALALLGAKAGATQGQLEQLRGAAMKLGLSSTFSPTQAIEGMTALSSAGLEVRDVLNTIGPTLKFAQAAAGKLTTEQASNLTAQAMAMFSVGSNQVGGMLDMMAKSADRFAMNIEDLPLGLANASRGTNALGASMDDTLISFGLMRKMMPRVESAGTAVGVAMESLAKKDVQQKLRSIGVAVEGAEGKFRPFLDIVGDMLPELTKMTQVQRAAFLQTTFGADAVQGLGAVFKQLEDGVTDSNGKLLKGADAIGFLRNEMKNSTGALDKLAAAASTGFVGAMEKLGAKTKTAAIALGEEWGKLVSPMVDAVGNGVAGAVALFDGLGTGAKRAIAVVTLGAAGLAAVFALAGGPVTLVLGAIVAGIAGIKYAVDNNIGGLGDKFASWGRSMKLAWEGISQLFSQGGFSGAVRGELNKAENAGIKQFAITVFVWGNRIKNFFAGIAEGFSVGMERAGPAFTAFGAALERVGVALGLTAENDPAANVDAWAKAGAVGAKIGGMLAGALEWVAKTITKVLDFAGGFASTFQVGAVFDAARSAANQLGIALSQLLGKSDPNDSTSGWRKFGEVLGGVATFGAQTLAASINFISRAIAGVTIGLTGVSEMMGGLMEGNWSKMWGGMKKIAIAAVKGILTIVGFMVERLATSIDAMGKMLPSSMGGGDFGASKRVSGLLNDLHSGLDKAAGVNQGVQAFERRKPAFGTGNETSNLLHNLARTAELGANMAGLRGTELGSRAASGINNLDALAQRMKPAAPSVVVNTYLDSEIVASRVETKISENAARGGGDLAPSF